jgi:uncharacterized membrane protein
VNWSVVLRIAFVLILSLYPFFVFFGLQTLPPGVVGLILAVLLMMRFGVIRFTEKLTVLPGFIVLFLYAVTSALLGSKQMLLYYPVLVNALLLVLFAGSLCTKEPLLVRFVRARGTPVGAHATRYLSRLTAVWAGFFVVNGLIAVWTTTTSIETWTIYNGIISYLVVAVLASGEWIYRGYYKKRYGIDN